MRIRVKYAKSTIKDICAAQSVNVREALSDDNISIKLRYIQSCGISYRELALYFNHGYRSVCRWAEGINKPCSAEDRILIAQIYRAMRKLENSDTTANINIL